MLFEERFSLSFVMPQFVCAVRFALVTTADCVLLVPVQPKLVVTE